MDILPILFSYNDVKTRFPNRKTYDSFLRRAQKDGKISQIRKDLYALIDPASGGVMASPFQIACRLSPSAFINFHLAMEYYGLAEQVFVSEDCISSLTPFRDCDFEGIRYRGILTSNSSLVADRMAEEHIRIVKMERLLVDAVDLPRYCGGYEEVSKAIGLIPYLEEPLLLSYLRTINKDVLFLKVGYLLETYYQGSLSPAFYSECLSHLSKKKYYFSAKIGNGRYISKWGLIVPQTKEGIPNELL
jgi:predicted transcriptional regulator of viral defense system